MCGRGGEGGDGERRMWEREEERGGRDGGVEGKRGVDIREREREEN